MSEDINVGQMSEAINDKMDRDWNNAQLPGDIKDKLIQAGIVLVIESYINPDKPTDGYRIWSDGYCEQWGDIIFSDDSAHSITFKKTFADTNYNITFGLISTNTSSGGYGNVGARSKTESGFTVWSNSSYITKGKNWRACGYLAEGQY